MSADSVDPATKARLTGLRNAAQFINMMASDLDRDAMHHRPCPDANCTAWILGHLTLTNLGGLRALGREDLAPPLPDDFAQRFARDDTAPKAADYGEVDLLLKHFNDTLDAYMTALQDADDETLNKPIEHPLFSSAGEMAGFFSIHIASHGGQISTIRRSLGMPPVI